MRVFLNRLLKILDAFVQEIAIPAIEEALPFEIQNLRSQAKWFQ